MIIVVDGIRKSENMGLKEAIAEIQLLEVSEKTPWGYAFAWDGIKKQILEILRKHEEEYKICGNCDYFDISLLPNCKKYPHDDGHPIKRTDFRSCFKKKESIEQLELPTLIKGYCKNCKYYGKDYMNTIGCGLYADCEMGDYYPMDSMDYCSHFENKKK